MNHQPRKVRGGIRLRSTTDDLRRNPPAAWILEALDESFAPDRRVAGLTYAVDGQVRTLEIHPGCVEAVVQCTRERPHRVEILLPVVPSGGWVQVAERMAREARIAARLAAGRVPASLAGIFRECGLSPVADELNINCTCRSKRPCKHAAAALFLAAEHVSAEPMRYFDLRGTSAEDLLGKLRQARMLDAQGQATAHARLNIDDVREHPPLEACTESFWRCPRPLSDAESAQMPPHLPHALLRRLGLSPMQGKFPMAGLLETIYDDVTAAARDTAGD